MTLLQLTLCATALHRVQSRATHLKLAPGYREKPQKKIKDYPSELIHSTVMVICVSPTADAFSKSQVLITKGRAAWFRGSKLMMTNTLWIILQCSIDIILGRFSNCVLVCTRGLVKCHHSKFTSSFHLVKIKFPDVFFFLHLLSRIHKQGSRLTCLAKQILSNSTKKHNRTNIDKLNKQVFSGLIFRYRISKSICTV